MTELPFLLTTFLLACVLILLFVILVRLRPTDWEPLRQAADRSDAVIRTEFSVSRQEFSAQNRDLRAEVTNGLKSGNDSLLKQMGQLDSSFDQFRCLIEGKQDQFAEKLDQRMTLSTSQTNQTLEVVRTAIDDRLDSLHRTSDHKLEQIRQTVDEKLQGGADAVVRQIVNLDGAFDTFRIQLEAKHDALTSALGHKIQVGSDQTIQTLEQLKSSFASEAARMRKETTDSLQLLNETSRRGADEVRHAVESRLTAIQTTNDQKLEQMRQTVDEKLQGTLDKRLGESFKQVSERLEKVHQGLGEMQTLASGVGDLKKVLTNVKARGTWGEVQLGALLEQILAPEQYERNVAIDGSKRVEFAVKLPGNGGLLDQIWLPIDSKFPMEDYTRVIDAAERGDAIALEAASCQLEAAIKLVAKDFSQKYLKAPITTDFGVIFLPTEGLYAEVLRRPGLVEFLQAQHGVVLTGPTTLAALLNSLRVGFRTLAIQQRASEVWDLLGAVKSDVGKFGDLLAKVRKKIDEAGRTIEDAERKTRTLEKSLRNVETPATPVVAIAAAAGVDSEMRFNHFDD
jgi:DNA recombination protein RmuC